MTTAPIPQQVKIRRQSGCLELHYEGSAPQELSFEFLRVHSPSAEVQGHGPNSAVLQVGKRGVVIEGIEPVGNYGLKLVFSDGHDSGIFTWPLLIKFCQQKEPMWERYLLELEQAGESREPSAVKAVPAGPKCGK